MLQILPPEIIQHIVKCMQTYPPSNREQLDYPEKGIQYFTWNKIYEPRHLLRLARTCKYLKSIVDPIIYENWGCHERLSIANMRGFELIREHGICLGEKMGRNVVQKSDISPTWFFISKPLVKKVGDPASYANKPRNKAFEYDPKFYIVAGCRDIPESAMKYVKHLGIVLNGYNQPHYIHLPKILPKMTSLTQVTIHMEANPNPDTLRHPLGYHYAIEFLSVIYLLFNYKGNSLDVHIHLANHLYRDQFDAFFRRFENEWKNWTKLKIKSLVVDTGLCFQKSPAPFSGEENTLKGLKLFFATRNVMVSTSTGQVVDPTRNTNGAFVRRTLQKKWVL